jgi:ATP-binding cassette subfamily F protein 3
VIRNILGGFLFSGDDIYKKAGVLSGGERTRLAVARMLLRPSNTLLLDEPTNHLDLDSKDVLLEALEDFGGTLIFVSHDRYFVDKLATKIIEVGHGTIEMYPGTYEQFLWSRQSRHSSLEMPTVVPASTKLPTKAPRAAATTPKGPDRGKRTESMPGPAVSYAERKKSEAEDRRRRREADQRGRRIADLEARISEREQAIKDLETRMAAPGFYDDRAEAEAVIARHRDLMWEVGDLMGQWESLQSVESSEHLR